MKVGQVKIREAVIQDAAKINAIYEPYILETAATFEYEPVSNHCFEGRMQKIIGKLPYLVCEIDGEIVGYSYLAPFKERAAFGWDVETTVYIHREYQRRNISTALYQVMDEIAKTQGYYNVYALITEPNEKSVKLHEKMGFVKVGLYPHTGYKLNQWWGLNVMCKTLQDCYKVPAAVKRFDQLDATIVERLCEEAAELIV